MITIILLLTLATLDVPIVSLMVMGKNRVYVPTMQLLLQNGEPSVASAFNTSGARHFRSRQHVSFSDNSIHLPRD